MGAAYEDDEYACYAGYVPVCVLRLQVTKIDFQLAHE